MRRIATFLLLLPLLLVAAPAHAQFAEGWTIVPEACHSCPAAWVCILEMLNNLVTLIMTIAVLIVILVITYAGILLVFTATNPENKSKAKSMLINAAIGLVIALGAWLIIDKVLESLGAGGIDETTRVIGTGGSACVVAVPPESDIPVSDPIVPGPGVPPGPGGVPDGIFTYQSGIQAQAPHASAALGSLLTCMANKVPAGVGQISSISSRALAAGTRNFQECSERGHSLSGCAHGVRSCHFGGSTCVGQSYAVDFGDEWNGTALRAAANECGANYVLDEGDHIHISVGAGCGCH